MGDSFAIVGIILCHFDRNRAHKHLCARWSGEISTVILQRDLSTTLEVTTLLFDKRYPFVFPPNVWGELLSFFSFKRGRGWQFFA